MTGSCSWQAARQFGRPTYKPYQQTRRRAGCAHSASSFKKQKSSPVSRAGSGKWRFEDYWLSLRLQQMDMPAIQLVQVDNSNNTAGLLSKRSNFTFESIQRKELPSIEQHNVMLDMLQRLLGTNHSPPFPRPQPHISKIGALSKT